MTTQEIAALVDGVLEGDPAIEILDGAPVDSAGPEDLAFLEPGSAGDPQPTGAGCLIVSVDAPATAGNVLIRVTKPRNAFARAMRALRPTAAPEPGVHLSAIVADSVELGEGASVGPGAVLADGVRVGARSVIEAGATLGRDSRIGEDCRICAGARIYNGVRIGDRALVHSGAVLGADGFGFVFENGRYEKFPQLGGLRIGDDFEIGANACVDRGALGDTEIGDGVKLDNLVHIAHNCRLGNHVVIASQTGLSGGVIVDDYVVMGGQVGIGERAHVEERAVLGGQTGLLPKKTAAAGGVFWGTPARPHREHLRRMAQVNRLPGMLEELSQLRQRVQELEQK